MEYLKTRPRDRWLYRVVEQDGAYVRQGISLASVHKYTIPYGTIFEVTKRRYNKQGIARLRTRKGWVSEFFNPLSSERGPIVEPCKLSEPLLFSVKCREGVIVREAPEDGSAFVRTIPLEEFVVITERRFSETPSDNCRPFVRLADGSGWVCIGSIRFPTLEFCGSLAIPTKILSEESVVRNDTNMCIICFQEPRTATFVHGETGHVACCIQCARLVKAYKNACPVCRLPVDSVIRHFHA